MEKVTAPELNPGQFMDGHTIKQRCISCGASLVRGRCPVSPSLPRDMKCRRTPKYTQGPRYTVGGRKRTYTLEDAE